jgi:hypothetical protein
MRSWAERQAHSMHKLNQAINPLIIKHATDLNLVSQILVQFSSLFIIQGHACLIIRSRTIF